MSLAWIDKITKLLSKLGKSPSRPITKLRIPSGLATAYQMQLYEGKAADSDYKGYGKPRDAQDQQSDRKGFRLPKQPKIPKARVLKGAPGTEKHTHAAALAQLTLAFELAEQTLFMRLRLTGRGDGEHACKTTAIFNGHHFANNPVNRFVCHSSSRILLVLFSQNVFDNNIQGHPNNHHKLPNMKGKAPSSQ